MRQSLNITAKKIHRILKVKQEKTNVRVGIEAKEVREQITKTLLVIKQ